MNGDKSDFIDGLSDEFLERADRDHEPKESTSLFTAVGDDELGHYIQLRSEFISNIVENGIVSYGGEDALSEYSQTHVEDPVSHLFFRERSEMSMEEYQDHLEEYFQILSDEQLIHIEIISVLWMDYPHLCPPEWYPPGYWEMLAEAVKSLHSEQKSSVREDLEKMCSKQNLTNDQKELCRRYGIPFTP